MTAVMDGEAVSFFTRASWPELGSCWYSGRISPPQWTLTMTASAPILCARLAASRIRSALAMFTDQGCGSGIPLVSVV